MSNDIWVSCGEAYRGPSPVSEASSVRVIGDRSEISPEAVRELNVVAKLPGVIGVWGMPDLHSGPTGCVIATKDCIYPRFVGCDAGCGMAVFAAGKARNFDAIKFKKHLATIDMLESNSALVEQFMLDLVDSQTFNKYLGTVGGSNHFAEFQAVDSVVSFDLMDKLGLEEESLLLTVHSGSRGFGKSIFEEYGNVCLDKADDIATYLQKHDTAVKWGAANRRAIAARLLADKTVRPRLDICHNQIVYQAESDIFVHRKGAAPANAGYVIIPGSRGSHSYIVMPKEQTDLQSIGWSLAHGAGRRLTRNKAKAKAIKKCGGQLESLLTTALNSVVACGDAQVLCEEIPEAYKNIDDIIVDLQPYVDVVAKLKPLLTIKDF